MVEVSAKSQIVIALDPGKTVGDLDSALIDRIESSEVVSKQQSVGNVQIRLAADSWKVVMATGVLQQSRIYQILPDQRV